MNELEKAIITNYLYITTYLSTYLFYILSV